MLIQFQGQKNKKKIRRDCKGQSKDPTGGSCFDAQLY